MAPNVVFQRRPYSFYGVEIRRLGGRGPVIDLVDIHPLFRTFTPVLRIVVHDQPVAIWISSGYKRQQVVLHDSLVARTIHDSGKYRDVCRAIS